MVSVYIVQVYYYRFDAGLNGKTVSAAMVGPDDTFQAFEYFIKGGNKHGSYLLSVDFFDKMPAIEWDNVRNGKDCACIKVNDIGPPHVFN